MSVVYVTGASAGLGRAIAQAFSTEGFTLGLIARDETALKDTAESLHGKAAYAAADVADYEEFVNAAQKIETEIGPPDIWINDAMATIFSRFEDIAPDEFERAVQTTFLGSVYGLQIALKSMKSQGTGQMIQIGSALAYRSIPLQAPYCASKLAIRGAVDSLRCELIHEKSPLRLTMVHMPAMNTPQFDWGARHVAHKPQPVPPIYAPEACAKAVLWAAKHPHMREVWVGKSTFQAILGNKLMPGFMDRYMAKNAFEGQFEEDARETNKQGNLFEPVAKYHALKGRFENRERQDVIWIGTSETREWLFAGSIAILVLAIIAGLLMI